MSPLGGDVDVRPRLHFDQFVVEPQPNRSLQQNNEFVLHLIVSKALGRGVAVRDDPLDADIRLVENRLKEFFWQSGCDVGEEVWHEVILS